MQDAKWKPEKSNDQEIQEHILAWAENHRSDDTSEEISEVCVLLGAHLDYQKHLVQYMPPCCMCKLLDLWMHWCAAGAIHIESVV